MGVSCIASASIPYLPGRTDGP